MHGVCSSPPPGQLSSLSCVSQTPHAHECTHTLVHGLLAASGYHVQSKQGQSDFAEDRVEILIKHGST